VCARAISDALRYPKFVIPAANAQHAAIVWLIMYGQCMLIGGHQMGRRAGDIEYHYQNHYITSKRPESKI